MFLEFWLRTRSAEPEGGGGGGRGGGGGIRESDTGLGLPGRGLPGRGLIGRGLSGREWELVLLGRAKLG